MELICENCGNKFIRRKFVRVPLCLKCLDRRRHPAKGIVIEKVDRNNQIMQAKKNGKKQIEIAREFGLTKQRVSQIVKRLTKRAADLPNLRLNCNVCHNDDGTHEEWCPDNPANR